MSAIGEPMFVEHLLDTNVYALGADMGDRQQGKLADVVALDASTILLYSEERKSVIDQFTNETLFIHLRTADFDRDGDMDLVAADHRNGNIILYRNPGTIELKRERWPKVMIDEQCEGAHAVALGDINGDGKIDIVASSEKEGTPPNSLFWYEAPEIVTEQWKKHVIGAGQAGGLAHYPAIGDLNGDKTPDVVHAAKGGNWYRAWLQPARPDLPWVFRELGTNYTLATNIQIEDVNRDGIQDLIATQGHLTGLHWFEGPDFTPHLVDQTLKSPHTLATGDFDSDGDIDFATCAFESRVLAWFQNDGRGKFRQQTISTNQAAYDLVARDMDGDGDLDFIVAGQESRKVSWYEQVWEKGK
ncbi:MAG: VCBS repeat-containing protein [Verrucomicrobiota bacterium]|nr:VCBS repeat-containing protein [Verrucomicrobiota bacterium]